MTETAPLTYRVLNIGRGIASAYAARLLADLGASVSWWRWEAPAAGEWPDDARFRRWFEAGVELLDRDCTLEELVGQVGGIAPHFDIVISDFRSSESAFGDAIRRWEPFNPALVVANADHFGRTGPYAHWNPDELTDYALGGYWALAGDPDREPLRVPGYQAQFHAGMQLAIAALAAAHEAKRTGAGQEVEATAVEAMVGAHWSTTIAWTHEGRILKRLGSDLIKAADGWVFFYRVGLYQNLFILIDRPDLMDDPRWSTIGGWLTNAAELWALVAEWCAGQPARSIVEFAQELRIPVTPMSTAGDLLEDPVLAERNFFIDVDGDRLPGLPYLWSIPLPAATATTQLVDALSMPPARRIGTESAVAAPPSGTGPLAGLRVLELTNNWAGPIAGRHLGDLGAEVIKIELATKPATRASHYPGKEPGIEHWNRSGYFNEMNRNKRSLALNLASERGRDLFLKLVASADVVLENNSARVMPNLGIGYEQLKDVNPRIIMTSISGFGATGARRDWVAFGSNIEAACGLAAITGYDGGLPQRTGSFVADPIAGGHATIAILAALQMRERTGSGAHIDISLIESALPFMLESFTYRHRHGHDRPRIGNGESDAAPVGAFRCAGTDDWVAVAVRTDDHWTALCNLAGEPKLAHLTSAERTARRDDVEAAVQRWTLTLTQYDATRRLQAAGIPAAPILHNWQMHSDPHLFARRAFIPIEHPATGVLPYPGFPWLFGRTQPSVRYAAPRFAEGNRYVFEHLLGLNDGAIGELYESGVTADVPVGLTAVVI